jgi:hypothetical protein
VAAHRFPVLIASSDALENERANRCFVRLLRGERVAAARKLRHRRQENGEAQAAARQNF